MRTYAFTLSLLIFLAACLFYVSCFCLEFIFIQINVFIRKRHFSPTRQVSISMKKVSLNSFNFSQIES